VRTTRSSPTCIGSGRFSTTGGTKQTLDQGLALLPPAALAPVEAYPLLYPLLDITTTLDPRFNTPTDSAPSTSPSRTRAALDAPIRRLRC